MLIVMEKHQSQLLAPNREGRSVNGLWDCGQIKLSITSISPRKATDSKLRRTPTGTHPRGEIGMETDGAKQLESQIPQRSTLEPLLNGRDSNRS